jgi:hypothetical protein
MSKSIKKKAIDVYECEYCDKEFNNEESAIKHEKNCIKQKEISNENLNKIDGWLAFLIFSTLFLSPIFQIIIFYYQADFVIDIIYGLIVSSLFILTGVFLLKKKPFAVTFAKAMYLYIFLSNIFELIIFGVEDSNNFFISMFITPIIWFVYLVVSKKIKVVYGNLKEKQEGYQIWPILAIIYSFLLPLFGLFMALIGLKNIINNHKLKGMFLSIGSIIISLLLILFFLFIGFDNENYDLPQDIVFNCNDFCYNIPNVENYQLEYINSKKAYLCSCLNISNSIIDYKLIEDSIEEASIDTNNKICSDNTSNGECSINKPYYCINGLLIIDNEKCGNECKYNVHCSDNEECKKNICVIKSKTNAKQVRNNKMVLTNTDCLDRACNDYCNKYPPTISYNLIPEISKYTCICYDSNTRVLGSIYFNESFQLEIQDRYNKFLLEEEQQIQIEAVSEINAKQQCREKCNSDEFQFSYSGNGNTNKYICDCNTKQSQEHQNCIKKCFKSYTYYFYYDIYLNEYVCKCD